MPGHKGRGPLGCEALDLTEIPGADSLYEAAGLIAESERNASRLFGCPTFYSTEGSSHCIRAMLLLASQATGNRQQATGADGRFRVLAARNVHRSFLTAAALLDLDVIWLPSRDGSYLSAEVTPEGLDQALAETGAAAVYLTCPDYLGNLPDLRPLAQVCHAHGALLLVDNAHGAYLRFLTPSLHPMDLGADLCCDSAHKTLPVLTGGAYLHVAKAFPPGGRSADQGVDPKAFPPGGRWPGGPDEGPSDAAAGPDHVVRDALALFGSTSPSYLILQSLDLANPYLEELPALLAAFVPGLEGLKRRLAQAGWRLYGKEPLKLTLDLRNTDLTGTGLAAALEKEGIFCEFSDPDFLVFMLTPQNTAEDLDRLEAALHGLAPERGSDPTFPAAPDMGRPAPERVCSLREAMLGPCQRIPAEQSPGRVLARPGVSCPPAVPVLMPGERIDEAALAAFRRYGIKTCAVRPETD